MSRLTAGRPPARHREETLFAELTMADDVTLSWRGETYEVVRKDDAEAEPEPGPVWQVTRDGAPVTSFPADPDDGPDAVREKVLAWLEANASRPTTDVGRH